MAEFFSFLEDWSRGEQELYTGAFQSIGGIDDPVAQTLFDNAYFNRDIDPEMRAEAREALDRYVRDEYGYEFDELFDWDAWRESYSEA